MATRSCWVLAVLWASQAGAQAVTSRSALHVAVPRASQSPKIDGVLDEAVWATAARLTGFTEYEPTPGAVPGDSTIGLVTYDRDKLYVAIIARGPARERRASVTPRDNAFIGQGDDGITVRLDTFNDTRRAYVLQVNPRGVQQDGTMEEGDWWANMDENFVWDAAAKPTADGYVVEIAIPFTSLHFPHTDSFDIGFNILRHYVLGTRHDSWAPRKRRNPCDICQEGVLTGIRDVSTRKTVDFRPYVMGAQAGDRAYDLASVSKAGQEWITAVPGAWNRTENEKRVGADVRFAVTRSYEINATIHPDFSQIEASPEQVRVNQRFALHYWEKRPFFTTGGSAFNTAGEGLGWLGEVFYSRDVVDPSVGVRLSGQSGGFTVAGLYAHDKRPAYFHYTGYEASGTDGSAPGGADVGVLRLKRAFGADSYVGILATRRNHGGAANQVFGGDMRLRLGRMTLRADAFHSEDTLPHLIRPVDAEGNCAPGYATTSDRCESTLYDGRGFSGSLLRAEVNYADPSRHFALSTAQVSPGFRSQLGTMNRVGVRVYGAGGGFQQYVRSFGLRELGENVGFAMTRSSSGELLDYSIDPSLSVSWMQGTSANVRGRFARSTFLGTSFDTRSVGLKSGMRFAKGFYVDANVDAGDQVIYDFVNPRMGTGWQAGLSAWIRPIPGILIQPAYTHVTTSERNGGPMVADADLLSMTAHYQRTPRLGFRLYNQFSDQSSHLIENPFDQRDSYVQSSFLMGYEIVSTSFVYVGLNDERRRFDAAAVSGGGYVRTGLRLFLKASYLLRM